MVFRCCNARDQSAGDANLPRKITQSGAYTFAPAGNFIDSPVAGKSSGRCRNRANQMRPMVVQSSEDFYLAKARTLGMYNSGRNQLTSDLLDEWAKETFVSNEQRNMVVLYRRWKPINTTRRVKRCNRYWRPSLANPGSIINLATDIDLGQNRTMKRSIA